jgi:hypothetical protein
MRRDIKTKIWGKTSSRKKEKVKKKGLIKGEKRKAVASCKPHTPTNQYSSPRTAPPNLIPENKQPKARSKLV